MTAKRDRVAELKAVVAAMRELDVTEYEGIKLGPAKPPKVELTEKQKAELRAERKARREEHKRDMQFAASTIKPVLRPVKEDQ